MQRQLDRETLEQVHAELHARLDRIEERLRDLEGDNQQPSRRDRGRRRVR